MPLVPLQQVLGRARSDAYGVGYFEAWDACSLEAVLTAAEEESAPVILGFGAMMVDAEWLDSDGVEVLGSIGRSYAERSSVNVALLFNEAHTLDQAMRGIDAGFNAVMIDTHSWPTDDAIAAVKELCRVAHESGVAVEGELGSPAEATASGIDHSHASLTDPDEAARFVEATGVDCLAVSVGNVHILMDHEAAIDMERLRSIHQRVDVPLVIHGGTSFPPAAVAPAIALGVAKFNVGTILKHEFWDGLESSVRSAGRRPDVHRLLGSHRDSDVTAIAQERMTAKVRSLIQQYGSSGRDVSASRVGAV
ncbi:MAG TPA: class II fructose-bisphosphate aldolase [Candidatus Saccharimonadales bacterium]|nr:class II fructose-bisphosphate aldolase [Candidatus Saccharimonadales bacterium]